MKLISPIPVEIEWSWACSKNKEAVQLLSRPEFANKARQESLTVLLSGYVTDRDVSADCIVIENGASEATPELNLFIEEADCRLIPHIQNATQHYVKQVFIISNDTDVVLYALLYFDNLKTRD